MDPRIPTATYRLQLNKRFTFQEAAAIAPYLQKLGISDLYSSPFFRSRSGSDHGYDVSNHNEFNLTIGSREDFAALTSTLQKLNMGHIADFVPNHMGITDPNNEWWMDVLENGPSSTFAPFFDIDWDPSKPELRDKVLLPVLGDQYGRILENGEFHILFKEGAFFVTYFDWVFPLNPRTYHFILKLSLEKLTPYSDEDMFLELESILTALEHLPARTETSVEKIRERAREKEVVKRRISRLCAETPQVRDAIDRAIHQMEGQPGDPGSFDLLDDLLSAQAYRLSYWRVAAEEINYRRFFDVNELAAIRVENPVVFETIHQLLFELLETGSLTGVRIDHVDGLQNPKSYLDTLRSKFQKEDDPDQSNPFYLIVEKILCEDERLRSEWPVQGTTGYEFTNDVTQLLVDQSNGDPFSRIYRNFIDRYVHFDSLVYTKKKLVMDTSLASDIESLGHRLSELAERDRLHRDFTLDSLSAVVRELIACFPVYRTYITEDAHVSEIDRQIILRAVRAAKRRNAAIETSIFDFLRDILLMERFDNFSEETQLLQIQFVLRFQQCTGPIMAKGLEDTAFYIFNRLAALNEVGGSPNQFGSGIQRFHERNRSRCAEFPQSLLASTSHDTKRSEDVRARMAVLSEMPEAWETWLHEWTKLNSDFRTNIDGDFAPNANEEYLLYQTLLGTWPLEEAELNDDYLERMQQYILKAIKEAKDNSSWIQQNEGWEIAAVDFVKRILDPEHAFRKSIAGVFPQIAWHGMLNSLSQTILKLTCPGVPDFYQGTELWDFSLVDPDNRRPVDYGLREKTLDESKQTDLQELFKHWQTGSIKLRVIHELLLLRRKAPQLFQQGNYSSLYASGERADCCVAFARKQDKHRLIVIAPRLTTRLGGPAQDFDWKETHLLLDESVPVMKELFTGRSLKSGADSIPLPVLKDFPFAVYHNVKL